jgi:hypothetical protein
LALPADLLEGGRVHEALVKGDEALADAVGDLGQVRASQLVCEESGSKEVRRESLERAGNGATHSSLWMTDMVGEGVGGEVSGGHSVAGRGIGVEVGIGYH